MLSPACHIKDKRSFTLSLTHLPTHLESHLYMVHLKMCYKLENNPTRIVYFVLPQIPVCNDVLRSFLHRSDLNLGFKCTKTP